MFEYLALKSVDVTFAVHCRVTVSWIHHHMFDIWAHYNYQPSMINWLIVYDIANFTLDRRFQCVHATVSVVLTLEYIMALEIEWLATFSLRISESVKKTHRPPGSLFLFVSPLLQFTLSGGLMDRICHLLWPPCVANADIIFLPCGYYLFFCSPNLSGQRLDVYHTSTHGVALEQI